MHQGLITHSIYVYLVTHYANPAELQIVVPTLMVRARILLFDSLSHPLLRQIEVAISVSSKISQRQEEKAQSHDIVLNSL